MAGGGPRWVSAPERAPPELSLVLLRGGVMLAARAGNCCLLDALSVWPPMARRPGLAPDRLATLAGEPEAGAAAAAAAAAYEAGLAGLDATPSRVSRGRMSLGCDDALSPILIGAFASEGPSVNFTASAAGVRAFNCMLLRPGTIWKGRRAAGAASDAPASTHWAASCGPSCCRCKALDAEGMLGMRGVAVKSLKRGFRVGLMGAWSWPAREAGVSAAFRGLRLLPAGGRAGDDVAESWLEPLPACSLACWPWREALAEAGGLAEVLEAASPDSEESCTATFICVLARV